jgi:hypothetical protein
MYFGKFQFESFIIIDDEIDVTGLFRHIASRAAKLSGGSSVKYDHHAIKYDSVIAFLDSSFIFIS